MVKEDFMGADMNIGDQDKLLETALQSVRSEAFQMKRLLDKGKLMEALKSCSQMLAELRTNVLTPKYYYRLFIDVTNELQHLELHLIDEFQKGRRIVDLYELVQYAGSIIPRLYLLITVGVVYIKTGESSRKDILKDLVEMCRGVQHPLRGLFLRSYLLQSVRTLLPDQKSEGELSNDGTFKDAVDFVLSNFCEMNKLWVRMQHQGSSKDLEKREKERLELRTLVGTNLVRLSELENLDSDTYVKVVLSAILEQVVSCKDHIAQEYLMECVIQVFPDEFHITTLNKFLKACAELDQNVKIKNILISLIDRLTVYVSHNAEVVPNLIALDTEATENGTCHMSDGFSLFDIFYQRICQVVESFKGCRSSLEDAASLHISLLNLAHKCYPGKLDYVDKVFQSIGDVFAMLKITEIDSTTPAGKDVCNLLKIPIQFFNDILRLLEIPSYSSVLSILDYAGRCKISHCIVTNALDNATDEKTSNDERAKNAISTTDQCESLLNLLESLIKSGISNKKVDQKPTNVENIEEDFEIKGRTPEDFHEEQISMARLIHLMFNENPDQYYLILNCARKHFGCGGKQRFKYTLPALIFSAYKVAWLYKMTEEQERDLKWEKKVQKVFQFCHQGISALIKEAECPETSLRLFLQGALMLDRMPAFENREMTAYEFFSQALSLYEDEIGDSKAQFWAITLIIGSLQKMSCFSLENLEPLRSQCVLAASKLFKKPDQSRGVALCAHLFWQRSGEKELDTKKAAECLKKSVKIVGQCMDPTVQVQLFVELLDLCIYFYGIKCPEITAQLLNQLLLKIRDGLESLASTSDGNADELSQIKRHFQNIVNFLQKLQVQDPVIFSDFSV